MTHPPDTARPSGTRVRRAWLVPTLVGYKPAWIGRDALAGLSAGAVVIPQAMAYSTIANLPVQIGLYTCMVPMLVYALIGGSAAMSVSTTSTIATLTATTLVTAGVAAGSQDALNDLVTLTVIVGIILVVARVLKLGSLVENISEATMIGIKVGVGATVAVGQLPKLLGVETNFSGHGFIRSIVATIEAIPNANLATVVLSASSIAVLLLMSRFTPRLPGPLIVVVAGILLAAFTGIVSIGVGLIPPVPSGLPTPVIPTFQDTGAMIPGALAIAVMAFLESASVARGIRQAGDPQVDSDRELLATGAANFIGAFFQSMPAAGGFSQSAVNQKAGARSQLATMVTVVLAVAVALFLGPVLRLLPQATLASIVFVAVIGLIDVKSLRRLARLSPVEFWIALVTAVVGLTVGLLPAVAVGVVLTLVMVLHELNRPRVDVLSSQPGKLALKLDSPLYTANVLSTIRALQGEIDTAGRPARVVLDVSVLRILTVMVIDSFTDFDREMAGLGVELHFAGLPDAALERARKTAWWQAVEESHRAHASVEEALSEE
ncbi:solute carrier family 26 protein [Leifsonia kafniensis]|uniref:Solute carrier family 26 protein n=1 Tax=Leifsonia kafniensis TaxID=475957 RepID=A0ABP7KI55_9MICO